MSVCTYAENIHCRYKATHTVLFIKKQLIMWRSYLQLKNSYSDSLKSNFLYSAIKFLNRKNKKKKAFFKGLLHARNQRDNFGKSDHSEGALL